MSWAVSTGLEHARTYEDSSDRMHSVEYWLILSACHAGLRGDQQQGQGALVKRLDSGMIVMEAPR
jgi:hypothetical protein